MERRFHVFSEEEFSARIRKVEEKLAEKRFGGEFAAFDGCPIHYEYYLAENPRGSLVIVHGFTEFSRKYEELSWYFLQQGYHVFLLDLRGHGLSGREVEDPALVHVNHYGEYVSDLEQYLRQIVRPVSGSLPVSLYGHSMGGAIVTLYLMEHPGCIRKAVLSSPMVVPVTPLPRGFLVRYAKNAAQKTGWKARFPHGAEFDPNPSFQSSSDASHGRFQRHIALRRMNRRYQNAIATNRWMYQTLALKRTLLDRKKLAGVSAKVLLLQAGKDRVVRLRPQKALAKRLPNCRLEFFPGAKHSIFNAGADILERYVTTILDFLAQDEAPSAI